MEKKSLNLDDIKLNFDAADTPDEDYAGSSSFRLASLLADFDITEIIDEVKRVFNTSASEDEINALRNSSVNTGTEISKMALEDYEKNEVLKRFASTNEIRNTLKKI